MRPENTETALALPHDRYNKIESIWLGIKMRRCSHYLENGAACLGSPIYSSAVQIDKLLCAEHAQEYLEDDISIIVCYLEKLKEGVKHLTHRGLPVSELAVRLSQVEIDDFYSSEEEDEESSPVETTIRRYTYFLESAAE